MSKGEMDGGVECELGKVKLNNKAELLIHRLILVTSFGSFWMEKGNRRYK